MVSRRKGSGMNQGWTREELLRIEGAQQVFCIITHRIVLGNSDGQKLPGQGNSTPDLRGCCQDYLTSPTRLDCCC